MMLLGQMSSSVSPIMDNESILSDNCIDRLFSNPSRVSTQGLKEMVTMASWNLTLDDTQANLVSDFESSLSGLGTNDGTGPYNMNDLLAVPIFKETGFQFILNAATSPATKLHEETLTYLNQDQSYEIKLKKIGDPDEYGQYLKSVVRVMFHERKHQYNHQEQFVNWVKSRPGERMLYLDVPQSFEIQSPRHGPINQVEFLWDPRNNCSAFVQIHCISTEFTSKKHGGEKGVPFKIQVDTFALPSADGDDSEPKHIYSSSSQIKVFKPKGADRKHKTDRDKLDKKCPSEFQKYQPSYECTVLTQCRYDPQVNWSVATHPVALSTSPDKAVIARNKQHRLSSDTANVSSTIACPRFNLKRSESDKMIPNTVKQLSSSPTQLYTIDIKDLTFSGLASQQHNGKVKIETGKSRPRANFVKRTPAQPTPLIRPVKTAYDISEPLVTGDLSADCQLEFLRPKKMKTSVTALPSCNFVIPTASVQPDNQECSDISSDTNSSPLSFIGSPNDLKPIDQIVSENMYANQFISPEATTDQVQVWLSANRFPSFMRSFTNYTGSDLLRMTKDDFMSVCGTAEGIRIYNALQPRLCKPKITIFVNTEQQHAYHAIYLEVLTLEQLKSKITEMLRIDSSVVSHVFRNPLGVKKRIFITDEIVLGIPNESYVTALLERQKTSNYFDVILVW